MLKKLGESIWSFSTLLRAAGGSLKVIIKIKEDRYPAHIFPESTVYVIEAFCRNINFHHLIKKTILLLVHIL